MPLLFFNKSIILILKLILGSLVILMFMDQINLTMVKIWLNMDLQYELRLENSIL